MITATFRRNQKKSRTFSSWQDSKPSWLLPRLYGSIATGFHLSGNFFQIREGHHIPGRKLIFALKGCSQITATFQPLLEKVTLLYDQVASALWQLVQFGLTHRVDQLGNAALHGPDHCQRLWDQLGNVFGNLFSLPLRSPLGCSLCSRGGLGSLGCHLRI